MSYLGFNPLEDGARLGWVFQLVGGFLVFFFFFEKNTTRVPQNLGEGIRGVHVRILICISYIYIYVIYILFFWNNLSEERNLWIFAPIAFSGLIGQKGLKILTNQRLQPPDLGCFSLCFFSRNFSQEFRPWDSIWDFPRYSRRGSGAQDIVCLLGENSSVVFFLLRVRWRLKVWVPDLFFVNGREMKRCGRHNGSCRIFWYFLAKSFF